MVNQKKLYIGIEAKKQPPFWQFNSLCLWPNDTQRKMRRVIVILNNQIQAYQKMKLFIA